MFLKTVQLSSALALLLSGCAMFKPHYSDEQMHAYLFGKFDGNGDGICTEEEYFDFIDKRFGKMDLNSDATITSEELVNSRFYTFLPALARAVFRDSDTDRNGLITREEMVDAEKARFDQMDLNGDRQLSKTEFAVNDMREFNP